MNLAHGGHHNWQQRHDWGQDGGYGYQDGGYGYGEHGGWEKQVTWGTNSVWNYHNDASWTEQPGDTELESGGEGEESENGKEEDPLVTVDDPKDKPWVDKNWDESWEKWDKQDWEERQQCAKDLDAEPLTASELAAAETVPDATTSTDTPMSPTSTEAPAAPTRWSWEWDPNKPGAWYWIQLVEVSNSENKPCEPGPSTPQPAGNRRRHSFKRPETPSTELTSQKKDLPVKWGPIKNATIALALFQGKESPLPLALTSGPQHADIPNMTLAEQIRFVQENFKSVEDFLSWEPLGSFSYDLRNTLKEISGLLFELEVTDHAEVVRTLKNGGRLDLKGAKTLQGITLWQCSKLLYWLRGYKEFENLVQNGPSTTFYKTSLNEKIWAEVLATHNLMTDWAFDNPKDTMQYINSGDWWPFVAHFTEDCLSTCYTQCKVFTKQNYTKRSLNQNILSIYLSIYLAIYLCKIISNQNALY